MSNVNISTTGVQKVVRDDGGVYDLWRTAIQDRFMALASRGPLFRTSNPERLFDEYLAGFGDDRQYYNCWNCQHFIERVGSLVAIDEDGSIESAVWDLDETPEPYRMSVHLMLVHLNKQKVTGVFLTDQSELGKPTTMTQPPVVWTHFATKVPAEAIWNDKLLTASQKEAEFLQEYILVKKNINEFTPEMFEQALVLLKGELLDRSEKVIGPVTWARDIQARMKSEPRYKDNLLWRAIATAPPGFAHFSNGMAGVLLQAVPEGKTFNQIKASMHAKMAGDKYRRPTAAPSDRQIEKAEEIVEKLGIAKSLARRFARFDEIETIWSPKPVAPASGNVTGGVFSHLRSEASKPEPLQVPATVMTWDKFQRTVLPDAKTIECLIPYGRNNFAGIVTAVDLDAPPILQWDESENRNPFSWYCYTDGSTAAYWGLVAGDWSKVTGISLSPAHWKGGKYSHFGNAIIIVLEGARDSNVRHSALFPEILKNELHHIRHTIEAYSKSMPLQGAEEASACGLHQGNTNWGATLRVDGNLVYKLDRWD